MEKSQRELYLTGICIMLIGCLTFAAIIPKMIETDWEQKKEAVSEYTFQSMKISNPMTFESYFYEKGALCAVSVEEHGYTIAYPDGRTVRVYGDVVVVIEKKEER